MSKFPKCDTGLPALVLALALALPAAAQAGGKLGLGRAALPEEIAAWDLDVRPDGTGLPPGSGDVLTGEAVFEENCAVCHGSFAEGVDNWPKLAGGSGTLADADPLKTVGSYWPYLSTVWDYVNRSMPFGNAQSLSDDEVYAVTAYILYSNELVDEDFVLSDATFLDVEMPNVDGFIVDDRARTEYAIWSGEPCMTDCKSGVEITMRARVLDVTPDLETDAAPAETAVAAEVAPEPEPVPVAAPASDPGLIAEGEKVFRKCKSCHQVGEGAKNRSGPVLNGVVGRAAGMAENFRYSNAFKALAEAGTVWNAENLAAFLSDPKSFAKGTKMSFRGLNKDEDIAAITAYLSSFTE
ncbi:MAG: c-type cytochrome [Rhodobacter sp.]|nr:c-type cytochrome [Rhodobacter sp.]